MKEQSNEFLYIFRGGADPKQMSPEQMQGTVAGLNLVS